MSKPARSSPDKSDKKLISYLTLLEKSIFSEGAPELQPTSDNTNLTKDVSTLDSTLSLPGLSLMYQTGMKQKQTSQPSSVLSDEDDEASVYHKENLASSTPLTAGKVLKFRKSLSMAITDDTT